MAALQQTPISVQSKTHLSLSLLLLLLLHPHKLKSTSSLSRGGGASINATAASSYASALAEVAVVNNTLETTVSDVDKLEKFFAQPSVFDFFASPTITLERKRVVLDEIATDAALQPHTVNFLNILVEAKRIDLIKEIVAEFETVYNRVTDTELSL